MRLRVEALEAGYGKAQVLFGVDLEVVENELVALLGANGAGKTTLLRAISGLVRPWSGRVLLEGQDLRGLSPAKRARMGLGHVPEGRQLFPLMTVEENLRLGAAFLAPGREREGYERVYGLFPRLAEKRRQLAGTLSGGEQQMLAIGRALMGFPKILLVDEPSLGLSRGSPRRSFWPLRPWRGKAWGCSWWSRTWPSPWMWPRGATSWSTGRWCFKAPLRRWPRTPGCGRRT
jgi:branched-chain amino acid transport system ATP-binding protein